MLAILSPAKNMRPLSSPLAPSIPSYLPQTTQLAGLLRNLPPYQFESLMRVNPAIAFAAYEAYQSFDPAAPGTPALLAYHGLLYQNLQAESFSPAEFSSAEQRLRILSAFYGLLRPLDGIQPYRLEFACRFRPNGQTLYAFWGERLCRDLFTANNLVINLASNEYSKAIRPHLRPGERMITCDFLVRRKGKLPCLPTYAKMARGQMARMIALEQLDDPEALKQFRWDGFAFSPNLSDAQTFTFVREFAPEA